MWLDINGERYSYVYIRKNACSSWKNLFIGESTFKDKSKNYSNPINFMATHHKINDTQELMSIKNRIVILRDPLGRLYSGFINQFIMRLNKERQGVVHHEISSHLMKDAESITFQEFVDNYILDEDCEVNAHFQHQSSHLADVEYNQKWLLESLYDKARETFGFEIADKYFKKKKNSTQRIEKLDGNYRKVKASEIFEIYQKTKKLPSFNSLLDEMDIKKLSEYYKKDYELIGKL